MNEDVFKAVYSVLKQYIPAKDLQQAVDHLVDDAQEYLEEDELFRLAGLDKYMKNSVADIVGEPDFEPEDEDDY
tara:strand:- start:50 stop:271 length:222 start_codon:yes stop_codon:yes gene_type:complete